MGKLTGLNRYKAERAARLEDELRLFIAEHSGMERIRTKRLSPVHMPWIPSLVPTRVGIGGDWN